MIKFNIEQGSEAWHAARAGRITGTRFKELMMSCGTKGYQDLIRSVTAEIITGVQEETYSNATMERGNELEPIARKNYALNFSEVEEVGFVIPDEGTPYHDWIGVSPDGLINGDGMIEIKCPLMKTHMRYIEENKLPHDYWHQVQGQLFVTQLSYCDFVSYYPNMKLFAIRIYPDIDLHIKYVERLNVFISAVETKLKMYKSYSSHEYSF